MTARRILQTIVNAVVVSAWVCAMAIGALGAVAGGYAAVQYAMAVPQVSVNARAIAVALAVLVVWVGVLTVAMAYGRLFGKGRYGR